MSQYRKTPRASFLNYDYGDYFITICTKDKSHYFGEIRNGRIYLSEIGKYIELQLSEADKYCGQCIRIPLFVVMPNHVHFIASTRGFDIDYSTDRCPNPNLRQNPTCQRHVPTLSRYVSSLKGAVTKYAHKKGLDFGWQPRYHDHAIRGAHDGNNIADYINNNIARWNEDCFNT